MVLSHKLIIILKALKILSRKLLIVIFGMSEQESNLPDNTRPEDEILTVLDVLKVVIPRFSINTIKITRWGNPNFSYIWTRMKLLRKKFKKI